MSTFRPRTPHPDASEAYDEEVYRRYFPHLYPTTQTPTVDDTKETDKLTVTLVMLFVQVLWELLPTGSMPAEFNDAFACLTSFRNQLEEPNASKQEVAERCGLVCAFLEKNRSMIHVPYVGNAWNECTADGPKLHEALKTLFRYLTRKQQLAINWIVVHVLDK